MFFSNRRRSFIVRVYKTCEGTRCLSTSQVIMQPSFFCFHPSIFLQTWLSPLTFLQFSNPSAWTPGLKNSSSSRNTTTPTQFSPLSWCERTLPKPLTQPNHRLPPRTASTVHARILSLKESQASAISTVCTHFCVPSQSCTGHFLRAACNLPRPVVRRVQSTCPCPSCV